jgi:hypothetical protein
MRMIAVATAISALLASACTHHQGLAQGSPPIASAACKPTDTDSDCHILVDVWPKDGGGCEVAVVRSQHTVGFKKDARDKRIEWALTSSAESAGFRFSSNGIEPKTTPAGNETRWNDNFKNGGPDHGGRQFKWKNLNDPRVTAAVDYHYMVNVELRRPPAPPITCSQDPLIRNQR